MGIAITVCVEDRLYDEFFVLKRSPRYLCDDL